MSNIIDINELDPEVRGYLRPLLNLICSMDFSIEKAAEMIKAPEVAVLVAKQQIRKLGDELYGDD